jgi:hypothetical protein
MWCHSWNQGFRQSKAIGADDEAFAGFDDGFAISFDNGSTVTDDDDEDKRGGPVGCGVTPGVGADKGDFVGADDGFPAVGWNINNMEFLYESARGYMGHKGTFPVDERKREY